MPLPPAIGTCTISGQLKVPPNGGANAGLIIFLPPSELIDVTDNVVLALGAYEAVVDGSGNFSITVPYNDNPGVTPTGWSYQVIENVTGGRSPFYVQVSRSLGPTVNYGSLVQAPVPSGPVFPQPWIPLAAIQAKGDMFSGSGAAVVARTAVGADGLVWTADSAAAAGASWRIPAGGTPIGPAGGDLGSTYPNPTVVATHLAAPLTVAQGGTGSAVQNFVDLTAAQSIAGVKTFTGEVVVPTPVNASNPVTKAYADAIASGLAVKTSVRAATVVALPANTYNNGSNGQGATLTANAVGALSADGVALNVDDRLLVMDEAAAANNGIYTVTSPGGVASVYVLTRATDMDKSTEFPGAFTFVELGTANSGAGFVLATDGPINVGTTALAFTQFSGAGEILAGTGLAKTGNTLSLATPVAIANGGTGAATRQAALNALTGTQAAGQYVRSDGANSGLAAIQAADVPTLNQNTTGTASNVTGTVAIANGGTGQTSASAAFNALSPNTTLGDITYGSGTNTSTRLAGSTSATKQFLTQTGNGSTSAAPAWGTIAATDLPTPAVTGLTMADRGIIAETIPASLVGSSGATITSGTLYLGRVRVPKAATITNLGCFVGTAGSGVTAAYLGLYDSTGALVASTADRHADAIWTAGSNPETAPLSSPYAAAAGLYWIGLLVVFSTTSPSIGRQSVISAATVNYGTSAGAGNLLFATYTTTGLSTLPPSFTPTSQLAGDNHAFYFGAT